MEAIIAHHQIPMFHRIVMQDRQSRHISQVKSGIIRMILLLALSMSEILPIRLLSEEYVHGVFRILRILSLLSLSQFQNANIQKAFLSRVCQWQYNKEKSSASAEDFFDFREESLMMASEKAIEQPTPAMLEEERYEKIMKVPILEFSSRYHEICLEWQISKTSRFVLSRPSRSRETSLK